jgi:hypothetical protein
VAGIHLLNINHDLMDTTYASEFVEVQVYSAQRESPETEATIENCHPLGNCHVAIENKFLILSP